MEFIKNYFSENLIKTDYFFFEILLNKKKLKKKNQSPNMIWNEIWNKNTNINRITKKIEIEWGNKTYTNRITENLRQNEK